MKELESRADLDRRVVQSGQTSVQLGCPDHVNVPVTAIYSGKGYLRLLCAHCGFEVSRIKVSQ